MAASELIAIVALVLGVGVVAQVLADRFQVPSVIFLIAAGILLGGGVRGAGVRTVSTTLATAQNIDNYIERPAPADWMGEIGRPGDVQEIEITSEELVGRTVRDVGPELPEGCLIALVARSGDTQVPDAEFTLQQGDRLTLIGRDEAVREAMDWYHPEA